MNDCLCEEVGFCAVRNIPLRPTLQRICKQNKQRIDSMLAAQRLQKELPQESSVSTVGTCIRERIETVIGRRLMCPDCLAYLRQLNAVSQHNHMEIVRHLSAQFPWPIWWREQHPQRQSEISVMIADIVPNTDCSPP